MNKHTSKVAVFEYYPHVAEISLTLPEGGEKTIVINPGYAFGKGFHPTTRLCIKELEQLFGEKKRGGGRIGNVLDLGCGSGVLGISAAALGASKVTGVDIDNTIVNEARYNVSENGQSQRVEIILGSVEDVDGEFDLVAANLLGGSLLMIADEISRKVKPGGKLILSGFKENEIAPILEKFRELGFTQYGESTEQEWAVLVLLKR